MIKHISKTWKNTYDGKSTRLLLGIVILVKIWLEIPYTLCITVIRGFFKVHT